MSNLGELIWCIATSNNPIATEEYKKNFNKYIYALIDQRVEAILEKKKSTSSDRIAVADTINSNIKSTASTIKIMSALASAPLPARDDEDWKEWMEAYKNWYDINREEALKIK